MDYIMKTISDFGRRAAFVTALFAAAICTNACDATPKSLKRSTMTTLPDRLKSLFETTKTVCFSQFLVVVPATATVVFGHADVDYPIEYYPGEGDKVAERVAAQFGEVEKERRFLDKDDITKLSMFGKSVDGAMPGQKLVFGSKDHVFYSIDSFIPIGKDLFVQHASTAVSKDEAITSLNTVASRLRLRADNEVPSEPGACIEGGFVALQPEFERASVGVRLREFPDVHFSVEVIKNQGYLVESSALEPRLKRAEQDGGRWYSRIKFFRRGARELSHWKGFEVLARKPAQEGSTESHQFAFVSLGALHDPLQPKLDVQLDTGVRDDKTASVKPSLTDEEAVALWDKLTSSIRVRPTGDVATQSNVPPAKTQLGEFVDTGHTCPQTGWWQCSDGGVISGGRRRHFGAGQSMPHAVLLDKPSAWQMFTGQRPTREIATVWELVEYDPDRSEAGPTAVGDTEDSASQSKS
jgi:hypothetical protein